mmetsp:Transcript_941/g.1422  ORF Transcript_941/g.1422 Transcript_941/m.1422 type:complete len:419 (-) Transcript_941:589-1845(-)|eukprot:CAMPEP_0184862154 /NCGR_PEP_ID=MMETSP0580-20130426/6662_1 /TAXON_ID=1118495 /ORGANISM="Dactyliosolen fragilissimus" /LENGTH=418 /DNA_ID=CAMNT_0027359897 /DNA_START=111 /DNA_END=1367 /DNA_ORIENTATION=-
MLQSPDRSNNGYKMSQDPSRTVNGNNYIMSTPSMYQGLQSPPKQQMQYQQQQFQYIPPQHLQGSPNVSNPFDLYQAPPQSMYGNQNMYGNGQSSSVATPRAEPSNGGEFFGDFAIKSTDARTVKSLPAVNAVDDDDDFFGDFSAKSAVSETLKDGKPSPSRISTEIELQSEVSDHVSDFTGSTATDALRVRKDSFYMNGLSSEKSTGTRSTRLSSRTNSPLENPSIFPPPSRPKQLKDGAKGIHSPLPDFDKIHHSGRVLMRHSFVELLSKKWREHFWIQYGPSKILFFQLEQDFIEWLTNPYLTEKERNKIVKCSVDFVKDLYDLDLRGYRITRARPKRYRDGSGSPMFFQFKLEKWMDYGPVIHAAFAARMEGPILEFQRFLLELLRKFPKRPSTTWRGINLQNINKEQDQKADQF